MSNYSMGAISKCYEMYNNLMNMILEVGELRLR